jgi:hypothetical protein
MRLKINAEVEQSSYQKYHRAAHYLLRQFDTWNAKFGHESIDFEVSFVPAILTKDFIQFSHTAKDRWSFIDRTLYVGSVIDAEGFKQANDRGAIWFFSAALHDALSEVDGQQSFDVYVEEYKKFVRLVLKHIKEC